MTAVIARSFQKLPSQTRIILSTCLYGLAAGSAAVAFQVGINLLYGATFEKLSHHGLALFLAGSFAIILITSVAVGILLNSFCPEAAGSGIPQLKLAFWKDFGFVRWRIAWIKFIAGIISIGGGSSLGREGPSVQLCGAIGSNLAGVLGEPKQNRRRAAAAGAAAGLAAAFNTPLAAVTFVLEEIIEDLNSRFLGSVLLAGVIGALVVHGLLGKQPAFTVGTVEAPTWVGYALTPIIAAVAALIGILFQVLSLELRSRQRSWHFIPGWVRPAVGGLLTWIIGAAVFVTTRHLGVFSLGYGDLSLGLTNQLGWKTAGALLAGKTAATILCYGLGGCGGIFSPTLFMGGIAGVFISGLVNLVVPVSNADQIVLVVVGMSACLGAVVRAPVTGILIVFEMTHEFSLVPALMLGALVSQAISRRLTEHNFYEAILVQDGHHLDHVIPPRDLLSWQHLPLSAIANFHPVIVRDLAEGELKTVAEKWPYGRFPVVLDGVLKGIVTRAEIQSAMDEHRPPKLQAAVTCFPAQQVRDLQSRILESAALIVVLLDRPGGAVLGVITLHDLLRAEMNLARATHQ